MKKLIISLIILTIFCVLIYGAYYCFLISPPGLLDWVYGQFGTNDFLVGTTVPFILGGLIYGIRRFLISAYSYIIKNFTVSVRINSTTTHFADINNYVYENYIWGVFRRNFVLSWSFKDNKMRMTSGYGRAIAMIHGMPGFIILTPEQSVSYEFKEFLEIKSLTFNPAKTSKKIYSEINDYLGKIRGLDKISVTRVVGNDTKTTLKPKRSIDSIFVPKEIKDDLVSRLKKFSNSEKSYVEKGLPWHMGVMLYGPPGTGKTSLIHAIASELGRNIHYHSSGSIEDIDIDPKKSIMVLEDIDSSDLNTNINSKTGVGDADIVKSYIQSSFSDTLNFLDGFLTPHGLVVIATTNHIDEIDPAILRPGRFDIRQEIGLMAYREYKEMCDFYSVESMPEDQYVPNAGATHTAKIKQQWQSDIIASDANNKVDAVAKTVYNQK